MRDSSENPRRDFMEPRLAMPAMPPLGLLALIERWAARRARRRSILGHTRGGVRRALYSRRADRVLAR